MGHLYVTIHPMAEGHHKVGVKIEYKDQRKDIAITKGDTMDMARH